ncbi:MAG TPA: DUF3105 domain-containing protein [Candidatus Limnocylindrales bacterium]|nr:DUF3105 domain-containing protein [Candidatus Limnocylindrales bacterium]
MTKRPRRTTGPENPRARDDAAAGGRRSLSPSGTPRAGRRTRSVRRYDERGIFDRYRTFLVGGFAVAGVALIGLFVFGAGSGAYACESRLTPGPVEPVPTPTPFVPTIPPTPTPSPSPTPSPTARPAVTPAPSPSPSPTASPAATATPAGSPSPSPSPSPVPSPTQRLGFVTRDMGKDHVGSSDRLRYAYCPPASGPHFARSGVGPLKQGFYEPSIEQSPGGWIHNLEHGFVVWLYSCSGPNGCPTRSELDAMRTAQSELPQTEGAKTCRIPNKVLVARFDSMTTRFAYVAWDRVHLSESFDPEQAKAFAEQWMDGPSAPEPGACDR